MIYFMIMGIIISFLAGKSPIRCFDLIRFRYPVIPILALLIQVIIFAVIRLDPVKNSYLLISTMIVLLCGLWVNRLIRGIKWIAAGLTLNIFAILLNQGRMPVLISSLEIAGLSPSDDARHQMLDSSYSWWLGDWIPLYKMVISIGDVLVGVGILVFFIMNSPYRSKNETD